MIISNLKIRSVFAIALVLTFSSCCTDEPADERDLSEAQKEWLPDSNMESFTMISDFGVQESYTHLDYLVSKYLEEDKCGNISSDMRYKTSYQSTLVHNNTFNLSLETLNQREITIEFGTYQVARYNFDDNEMLENGYGSDSYPNPLFIEIIQNWEMDSVVYPEVMHIQYDADDIDELDALELVMAKEYGLLYYRQKDGVSFKRKF